MRVLRPIVAALLVAFAPPASAQRLTGAVALPIGVASRGTTSGPTIAPDLALRAGPLSVAASAVMMGDGARLWLPAGIVALTSRLVAAERLHVDAVGDVRGDAVPLASPSRSASLGGDAMLQVGGGTTIEGSGRLVRRWGNGAFPGGESSVTAWTAAWRTIDVGGSLRSRWGSAREESLTLDSSAVEPSQCDYIRRTVNGVQRLVFSCPRRTASLDVAFGVRGGAGPVAVSAWLGRRAGARGIAAQESADWGTVRLSWATSAATSLVGELARQPSDVARGIPAHTRAFVGIRVTPFARAAKPASAPPAAAPSLSIKVSPEVSGMRTISIIAPDARSVELTGDMTAWHVVALTRDGHGRWTTTLALAPGQYTCNVRIDGGAWVVPAGLPAVDDALGGRAGVLTVEP